MEELTGIFLILFLTTKVGVVIFEYLIGKKKSAKNLVGKKVSHLAKISHFLPVNFFNIGHLGLVQSIELSSNRIKFNFSVTSRGFKRKLLVQT